MQPGSWTKRSSAASESARSRRDRLVASSPGAYSNAPTVEPSVAHVARSRTATSPVSSVLRGLVVDRAARHGRDARSPGTRTALAGQARDHHAGTRGRRRACTPPASPRPARSRRRGSGRRCGCRWGRRHRAPAGTGRCAATTAASVSSMSVPGTKSPGALAREPGRRVGDRRVVRHRPSVVAVDDRAAPTAPIPSTATAAMAAPPRRCTAPAAALPDRGLQVGCRPGRRGWRGRAGRGRAAQRSWWFLSMDSGAARTAWRRSRARAVWLLTVPSGDAEDDRPPRRRTGRRGTAGRPRPGPAVTARRAR